MIFFIDMLLLTDPDHYQRKIPGIRSGKTFLPYQPRTPIDFGGVRTWDIDYQRKIPCIRSVFGNLSGRSNWWRRAFLCPPRRQVVCAGDTGVHVVSDPNVGDTAGDREASTSGVWECFSPSREPRDGR